MKSVIGLHDLKHLQKGTVEHMVGVNGRHLARESFYSSWFRGRVGGSEVLLEQVQLNFSFRSKFIIVLPCGLLVDKNTFLKTCIFKMSYWLH